MDRGELPEGIKSIFGFIRNEEKSYQECLKRYIEQIDNYKQIILFGGAYMGYLQ